MLVRSARPFNAEPPVQLLSNSFLTPIDIFYIRNHLPVPLLDEIGQYKFTIELEKECEEKDEKGNKKYEYTILGSFTLQDVLKHKEVSIVSTMQCAGNRRSDMHKSKPVKGLQWGQAAIGNGKWTGIRLRDVLKSLGVHKMEGIKHIHCEGLDMDSLSGDHYEASIPLETALSKESDVILAYKMNDEEIPRDHGYPLRLIVPGTVGARNVKWVNRLILSKDESRSHWQQHDYKLLSPFIDWTKNDETKVPPIQELPVNSVTCIPANESHLSASKEKTLKIAGYAVSGGGRDIQRVDISLDGGVNWTPAQMVKSLDGSVPPVNRAWGWTIWSIETPLPQGFTGPIEIICKAVDTACNQQPEDVAPVWNARGLLCTTWHKTIVHIDE